MAKATDGAVSGIYVVIDGDFDIVERRIEEIGNLFLLPVANIECYALNEENIKRALQAIGYDTDGWNHDQFLDNLNWAFSLRYYYYVHRRGVPFPKIKNRYFENGVFDVNRFCERVANLAIGEVNLIKDIVDHIPGCAHKEDIFSFALVVARQMGCTPASVVEREIEVGMKVGIFSKKIECEVINKIADL